jgi:poly-gamma-glutamate capsule biosynthesis protein CapA/YwtB (metallophosphatase superfamily)
MRRVRKKKRKNNIWVGMVLSGSIVIASIFLFMNMYESANASPVVHNEKDVSARALGVEAKNYEQTISLGAVGDILIHDWVYEDAQTGSGYDFHPMFEHISKALSQPDILLANQETILGGVELGISSYPMFNSPIEIGSAIKDAGVDIVSTANNHSLDKREKGLLTSLTNLDRIGIPSVGTYTSLEDQQTLTVMEKNGIKVAYLSYTYGTNGMPIPEGKDYVVNLIDKEAMKNEIHRAREVADVTVMSIHWGNEYQRFPTDEQEELAQFLVDEGVDIIFGHHPHVLQPMEWLKASDGRKALVVYSLGNFLSGQMRDYKDIGGMATIQVTKKINSEGSSISLSNPGFTPTYVANQRLKNYRVVPLKEAGKFGLSNADSKYNEIMTHMTRHLK